MQTDTEATSSISQKSGRPKRPAPLLAALKQAVWLANTITENELENRYALGALVLQVQEKSKYGDGAVAALAAATDLDVNTLHAHGVVAGTWSVKEFTALTKKRGGKRRTYRLSWSHFVLLAAAKDGPRRDELITAAFRGALSEKELRALKAEKAPRLRLHALKPAESQASVLEVAKELVSKGEQFKAMLETSIDEPTPELTAQLNAADQVLAQLQALLAVTRTRINAARSAPPAPTLNDAVAQVLRLPASTSPNHDGEGPGTQPA